MPFLLSLPLSSPPSLFSPPVESQGEIVKKNPSEPALPPFPPFSLLLRLPTQRAEQHGTTSPPFPFPFFPWMSRDFPLLPFPFPLFLVLQKGKERSFPPFPFPSFLETGICAGPPPFFFLPSSFLQKSLLPLPSLLFSFEESVDVNVEGLIPPFPPFLSFPAWQRKESNEMCPCFCPFFPSLHHGRHRNVPPLFFFFFLPLPLGLGQGR